MSYASVLRSVHIAAKDTKANVRSIRRTPKGELIFRLGRSDEGAKELQAILTEVAGPTATIRRSFPSRVINIKDLDEVVTKEDVITAITMSLGEEQRSSVEILNMRPAHSGTQVCAVRMPRTSKTDTLLKEGRVKIGLVWCRVRERVEVLRCYRCLNFGHIAARCDGPDRSKECRRCGQMGHLVASRCASCRQKSDNPADAAHFSGSSRCRSFRDALTRGGPAKR